jgi:pyridoxal phosphate phosphatase PHOSPHO2
MLICIHGTHCSYSQDMVLCRRYRGLEGKIASRRDDVKCQVKYWAGAWEVEEIFASL